MDCRYAARSRVRSLQTAPGGSPCSAIGPKTEPSPTSSQSTSRGIGAQGAWLETRVISAISGGVVRRRALGALEGGEGVLVGHRWRS